MPLGGSVAYLVSAKKSGAREIRVSNGWITLIVIASPSLRRIYVCHTETQPHLLDSGLLDPGRAVGHRRMQYSDRFIQTNDQRDHRPYGRRRSENRTAPNQCG